MYITRYKIIHFDFVVSLNCVWLPSLYINDSPTFSINKFSTILLYTASLSTSSSDLYVSTQWKKVHRLTFVEFMCSFCRTKVG